MITVDFNRLDIRPGFRILDIGCGSGRHTCGASKFEKVVAIGADINFDDVLEAKNRLACQDRLEPVSGSWATAVMDITGLPFGDNAFDLVICSEVLEHIRDQRGAALEISRVLKPGRNLAVSVPRYLPERICWALSKTYPRTNNGHLRIYKKTELIDLLESAGVKKWAVHYAHSLHTPYWWLKCLVGPDRKDSALVNRYHDLLVWDIMKHPRMTRFADRLLNPLLGKSIVIYFRKPGIMGNE